MLDNLPDGVLLNVLRHIEWEDLARVAIVSKQARALSTQLQVERFISSWEILDLQGWPRHRPLPVRQREQTSYSSHTPVHQAFELCHFMLRHVVHKSDNFARLSITYGCDPATIRAVNNIISDASLQSRLHIYLPVRAPEQLTGRVACVVFDRNSGREHVVALSPEEAEQEQTTACPTPRGMQALRRLSRCLSKGLRVDDDTAAFYLMEAGGDVRTALQLYSTWY